MAAEYALTIKKPHFHPLTAGGKSTPGTEVTVSDLSTETVL